MILRLATQSELTLADICASVSGGWSPSLLVRRPVGGSVGRSFRRSVDASRRSSAVRSHAGGREATGDSLDVWVTPRNCRQSAVGCQRRCQRPLAVISTTDVRGCAPSPPPPALRTCQASISIIRLRQIQEISFRNCIILQRNVVIACDDKCGCTCMSPS